MSDDHSDPATVLLGGGLAHPAVAAVLGPGGAIPAAQRGAANAGGPAGAAADGVPRPGDAAAALRVAWTPALARLARAMGLARAETAAGPVLSLPGGWGTAHDPALVAELARMVLEVPPEVPAAAVAERLGLMLPVAASCLRARATQRDAGGGRLPAPDPAAVEVLGRAAGHAGYHALDVWTLRHRRHDGGWSAPLRRDVLVAADAVLLLPWDPVRDRVLVIDQFRIAPAARGEPQAWMLEPIAGRVDAGETPAEAAIREAAEEAGLALDQAQLVEAPGHYPSPGTVAEYHYAFVALADLPDGAARDAGLACEGEDIRGHLVPRAELTAMAREGRLPTGPLALLALWLELEAPRLRAGAATTGQGGARPARVAAPSAPR